MKRIVIGIVLAAILPAAAGAAEVRSEYTEIDLEKTCAIFDVAPDDESFASYACSGWRGYPVLVYAADARESVVYGFPSSSDHVWESFSGLNQTAAKVEWRIEVDGERQVPFAAIHRWYVHADAENPEKRTEVLVVEKVGQPGSGESCAVGLVVASGNPKANETARKIADEQARDFACEADERVVVSGDVALPEFSRQEN